MNSSQPFAPLVIAHAACKGHAPENTLAGITKALDLLTPEQESLTRDLRGHRKLFQAGKPYRRGIRE